MTTSWRVVFLLLALVIGLAQSAILHGLFNDSSFEDPFDGSLAISNWFVAGFPSTRSIDETEFAFTASQTIGGETRTGLIRFADADGGGKITYEMTRDRCSFQFLGPLNSRSFSWNYGWGKIGSSGGFISAKMLVINEASSFGVTFVYLAPDTGGDVWHDEVLDIDSPYWVMANCFWTGEIGNFFDGDIRFISSTPQVGILEDAFNNELFPIVDPGTTVNVHTWADVGGTKRSIRAWLDRDTDVSDIITENNINPFAYALRFGNFDPSVFSTQLGIGSGEPPIDAYLDYAVIRFGENTYDAQYTSPNTQPVSALFPLPDCICPIIDNFVVDDWGRRMQTQVFLTAVADLDSVEILFFTSVLPTRCFSSGVIAQVGTRFEVTFEYSPFRVGTTNLVLSCLWPSVDNNIQAVVISANGIACGGI